MKKSDLTYNLVKRLLEENPIYRDSDKKLLWEVWKIEGFVDQFGHLSYSSFINPKLTPSGTITRCRRKIQEITPSLRGSSKVRKWRMDKAKTKGVWIYKDRWNPLVNKMETIVSFQEEGGNL